MERYDKQKKLKILIRTSGGRAKDKELGYGHIFRSINLAKKLKGNEINFLIENYYGVENIIKESGFKKVLNLKKNISLNSDINETIKNIKNNHIDILIIDKYNLNQKYITAVKKIVKTVLITDLKKINYEADLIVNGFIGFDNQIIFNKYGSKCLLGPSYQILNKKFSKKKSSFKKRYDVLATFGGYDEKNIIKILLKALESDKNNIKTKIILGPGTKKSKEIMQSQRKNKLVRIIECTKNMYKEMLSAKFGICSGGVTTYEFASLNIPFVIICQVKHQLITAKEWGKRGIAINLGMIDDNTSKKIGILLNQINKIKIKKQITVDGKGSMRVAREIIKLSKSI